MEDLEREEEWKESAYFFCMKAKTGAAATAKTHELMTQLCFLPTIAPATPRAMTPYVIISTKNRFC